MRRIPMTIIVHTNKIPFSAYGDISLLGETMITPIMRCKFCGVQPEFMYHTSKSNYEINHTCKIDNSKHRYTEMSYEGLAKVWNQERGRKYETD